MKRKLLLIDLTLGVLLGIYSFAAWRILRGAGAYRTGTALGSALAVSRPYTALAAAVLLAGGGAAALIWLRRRRSAQADAKRAPRPAAQRRPAKGSGAAETTPAGAETVPMEGATAPMGEETVPMGDSTVPMGDSTVPMGDSTVPMGDATIPMGTAPLPAEAKTIPMLEDAAPGNEDGPSVTPAPLLQPWRGAGAQPARCPQCGAALKAGQRFCTRCGAPIQGGDGG